MDRSVRIGENTTTLGKIYPTLSSSPHPSSRKASISMVDQENKELQRFSVKIPGPEF